MVEKIKYIKNLAVINDFDWDSEVVDDDANFKEQILITVEITQENNSFENSKDKVDLR